jgi:hypothetical protein
MTCGSFYFITLKHFLPTASDCVPFFQTQRLKRQVGKGLAGRNSLQQKIEIHKG